MSLEQSDLDEIERIIDRNYNSIAHSISRSFEHLDKRMDSVGFRVFERIVDLECKIEGKTPKHRRRIQKPDSK